MFRELRVLSVGTEPRRLCHDAVPRVEREDVDVKAVHAAVVDAEEVSVGRLPPHEAGFVFDRPSVPTSDEERQARDIVAVDADVDVVVPGDDVGVARGPQQAAALEPVADGVLVEEGEDVGGGETEGAQAAGGRPAAGVHEVRGVSHDGRETARRVPLATEPVRLAIGGENALDAETTVRGDEALPVARRVLPAAVSVGEQRRTRRARDERPVSDGHRPATQRRLQEDGGTDGPSKRRRQREQVDAPHQDRKRAAGDGVTWPHRNEVVSCPLLQRYIQTDASERLRIDQRPDCDADCRGLSLEVIEHGLHVDIWCDSTAVGYNEDVRWRKPVVRSRPQHRLVGRWV